MASRCAVGGGSSEADADRLFRRLAEEGRQEAAGLANRAEPEPATIAEGIRILEHAFERYCDSGTDAAGNDCEGSTEAGRAQPAAAIPGVPGT